MAPAAGPSGYVFAIAGPPCVPAAGESAELEVSGDDGGGATHSQENVSGAALRDWTDEIDTQRNEPGTYSATVACLLHGPNGTRRGCPPRTRGQPHARQRSHRRRRSVPEHPDVDAGAPRRRDRTDRHGGREPDGPAFDLPADGVHHGQRAAAGMGAGRHGGQRERVVQLPRPGVGRRGRLLRLDAAAVHRPARRDDAYEERHHVEMVGPPLGG